MDPILLLDEKIVTSSYEVEEDQSLKIRMAAFDHLQDCQIDIHVKKNATFEGVFADFSNSNAKVKVSVYLEGEGAYASFRTSALAKEEARKTFDISIIHVVGHTEGLMDCYGICQGKSRLIFTGVSKIDKGAKDSNTRQSAKIIVFDPSCLGRCSPILKIDENAVKASHAAVVGKLNDDHLFYLQSRGLSLNEARKLITQGYLLPIAAYFDEKERTMIMEAIEKQL